MNRRNKRKQTKADSPGPSTSSDERIAEDIVVEEVTKKRGRALIDSKKAKVGVDYKTDLHASEKSVDLNEDKTEEEEAKPTKRQRRDSQFKDKENLPMTFKISSWNVGGVRALIKKVGLNYITEAESHIVCLQEVRCDKMQLPKEIVDISNYKKYWIDSKKAGYAGCGILSKETPLSMRYGIGDDELDSEGRCITLEFERFYLVNVYVPNAGRKLVTLDKRLKWNTQFETHVKELDAVKPIIIAGDMNVSHNEIDLARPKENQKNAGFSPKEREGMTDLLNLGFTDTFRSLYPDLKDQYTFWSYMGNARARNVGWRLDYFIVSNRLVQNIIECRILSQVKGSDHCPIELEIEI